MTRKYLMRERIFLNEDFENSVFVVAAVTNSKETSDREEFDSPDFGARLKISGTYDSIDLQFALELPDQSKESIKQIKKLERMLRKFRKAVEQEARNRKKLSYKHLEDSLIK